jgi:cell division protein FtsA
LLFWAAGEGRTLHDLAAGSPRPTGVLRRIVEFIRERV